MSIATGCVYKVARHVVYVGPPATIQPAGLGRDGPLRVSHYLHVSHEPMLAICDSETCHGVAEGTQVCYQVHNSLVRRSIEATADENRELSHRGEVQAGNCPL